MKKGILFGIFFFLMISSSPIIAQSQNKKKLEKELQALLNEFHGEAGLYVYHLKKNMELGINEDTLFPTASIIKVPILIGVFHKILNGELDFDSTFVYTKNRSRGGSGLLQFFEDSTKVDLDLILSLSIKHSDNVAAVWAQELAGGGESINRFLAELGYTATRINSSTEGRDEDYERYGWGQTTPKEMARLLLTVRNQEILSPAACDRIYRYMTGVYWDRYALAEIPPTVQTASKQGMVNASRSELVMVNAPHGDYVFYIATKNNEDQRWKKDNEAWELARKVSKILWNYFEPRYGWQRPEHPY